MVEINEKDLENLWKQRENRIALGQKPWEATKSVLDVFYQNSQMNDATDRKMAAEMFDARIEAEDRNKRDVEIEKMYKDAATMTGSVKGNINDVLSDYLVAQNITDPAEMVKWKEDLESFPARKQAKDFNNKVDADNRADKRAQDQVPQFEEIGRAASEMLRNGGYSNADEAIDVAMQGVFKRDGINDSEAQKEFKDNLKKYMDEKNAHDDVAAGMDFISDPNRVAQNYADEKVSYAFRGTFDEPDKTISNYVDFKVSDAFRGTFDEPDKTISNYEVNKANNNFGNSAKQEEKAVQVPAENQDNQVNPNNSAKPEEKTALVPVDAQNNHGNSDNQEVTALVPVETQNKSAEDAVNNGGKKKSCGVVSMWFKKNKEKLASAGKLLAAAGLIGATELAGASVFSMLATGHGLGIAGTIFGSSAAIATLPATVPAVIGIATATVGVWWLAKKHTEYKVAKKDIIRNSDKNVKPTISEIWAQMRANKNNCR